MTAVVDIYNMALSALRAPRVLSTSEGSKEASYCGTYYDTVRRQVLTDAPWSFSTSTRALALLTEEDDTWEYVYQRPLDVLEVIDVTSRATGHRVGYETAYHPTAGTVILTDCEDAVAKVKSDVELVNSWPPHLQFAVAHLLASYVAIPLAGVEIGAKMQADQLALYNQHLSVAIAKDAMFSNTEDTYTSGYEQSRT